MLQPCGERVAFGGVSSALGQARLCCIHINKVPLEAACSSWGFPEGPWGLFLP